MMTSINGKSYQTGYRCGVFNDCFVSSPEPLGPFSPVRTNTGSDRIGLNYRIGSYFDYYFVLEVLNVNDTNLASPSLRQHACAHICIWDNFNQLRPPHPPLHKRQIFFLCLLRTLIVGTRQNRLVKEYTQQAHAVIATSDQRPCNVITFMQRHIYVVARTLI